jgi:phage baseplate assembly protein W
MVRDWESRCRLLEERVRIVETEGIELEIELKRVSENKIGLQNK